MMPQVLESIFDLLVNHLRMLRWHEATIAQHQSQDECLQVCVLLGDESLNDMHIAVAAAHIRDPCVHVNCCYGTVVCIICCYFVA
jgi:hypothetical protein